jgi:hypothetical protein
VPELQVTGDRAERPWEALPPESYEALGPHLPALAEEIIEALRQAVPAYARPLEGDFGLTVRGGVEQALSQFVEMALNPGVGRTGGRDVYVELGRREVREGRSLEALLAAYRVGARVAWRRLAQVGLDAGLPPEVLVLLAESIFAYIDQLSAESAEGFAAEQAERAGEIERRRAALIALLVQRPAPEPAAVTAAADAAHWPLPRTLRVVVWPPEAGRSPATRLPVGSVTALVDGLLCAVIPDPGAPGRGMEMVRALDDVAAGVGSAVAWPEASRSFRRAVAALGLARERPETGAVDADAHRLTLLLRSHPVLLGELAQDRLAPLSKETELSRARLTETLLAWLRHQGSVPATAQELIVHPQTVRYRLGRLREVFGPALEDPEARFELELVLRASPLLPVPGG